MKPIFVSVSRIGTNETYSARSVFLSFFFFFFSRAYRQPRTRIGSALIRDVSFESGQGYKICWGGGRAGKKESSRKENINTIAGQGVVFYLRVLVVGITLQRFLSPPSLRTTRFNIERFFFFFLASRFFTRLFAQLNGRV